MHTIFFDIDGTLVNTASAGSNAMVAAISRAFDVPADADGICFAGRSDHWLISQLLRKHGVDDSPENRQTYIPHFLATLREMLTLRNGTVLPGVVTVLEELVNRPDVRLALITGNLRQAARLKLDHYGLSHYFHRNVAQADSDAADEGLYAMGGFGDFHPERNDIARSALRDVERRLSEELAMDKLWVIGDTPHDVRCARAIGARAVAVATGRSSCAELAQHNPDLVVADLTEGTRWLEMIR